MTSGNMWWRVDGTGDLLAIAKVVTPKGTTIMMLNWVMNTTYMCAISHYIQCFLNVMDQNQKMQHIFPLADNPLH